MVLAKTAPQSVMIKIAQNFFALRCTALRTPLIIITLNFHMGEII